MCISLYLEILRISGQLVEVDPDISLRDLLARMIEPNRQEADFPGLFVKVIAEGFSQRVATDLKVDPDFSRDIVDVVVSRLSPDRLLEARAAFRVLLRRFRLVRRKKDIPFAREVFQLLPGDSLNLPRERKIGLFARFLFSHGQHFTPTNVLNAEPREIGDSQARINAQLEEHVLSPSLVRIAAPLIEPPLDFVNLFVIADRVNKLHILTPFRQRRRVP